MARFSIFLFIVIISLSFNTRPDPIPAAKDTFFQFRIYHLKNEAQQQRLDSFLRQALLPALHRSKLNYVGVFTKIRDEKDTSERLTYVVIPLKSIGEVLSIDARLSKDETYKKDGAAFLHATSDHPAYERFETIISRSFPGTGMSLPALTGPRDHRVYELRSYESASENILDNKVEMFTEGGETAIFDRLGFNSIFYSAVVAGGRMPNLLYITSFATMADRDKHWDAFGNDPTWKTLSAKPEYQHNVSRIDITFLRPTGYSDY